MSTNRLFTLSILCTKQGARPAAARGSLDISTGRASDSRGGGTMGGREPADRQRGEACASSRIRTVPLSDSQCGGREASEGKTVAEDREETVPRR